MDSPLCTQSACGLWSSSFAATELEANCSKFEQNAPEAPEDVVFKPLREEKQRSTAKVLIEKQVPYKEDGESTAWQSRAVCELDHCDPGQHELFSVNAANTKSNRFDENKNITASCCDPDNKKVEDGAKEFLVNGRSNVKHQACVPGIEEDAESKDCVNGYVTSEQKLTKCLNGQITQETDVQAESVAANRSYVLGYFAEKLSEAYKDAGRRLQGTRDIIRNVGTGEMKIVLSQYVTMMSKELPLIRQMQLKPQSERCTRAVNKVRLIDLSRDCALSLHPYIRKSVTPGVSERPQGSVSSFKDTNPEVFCQRLVELPPALSQLQTFPSTKILEKLESLSPQIQVRKPRSIFWLKTANSGQPIPKPGCLVLSEKDITVVSAGTDSEDTLALFHHFNLLDIKTVQISLAGQHVRLIGCTKDEVLAVFTYSKELTQEFCKALLKVLAPQKFSEGPESHSLLSDDLMVLSLDWTSVVPDIILDSGLYITSRFKRVLADLLYIVHGNMDGPGKPSLADVCPLLYTSVKIKNSTQVCQDTIFQFLLTDTHIALVREDGVFHPVPRGSSLVPVQPQFQGLKLRNRSDIRCLVVRQKDNCLVVDIVFKSPKPKTQIKKAESGPGSDEVAVASDYSYQCDSWKLSFGCTSEAVIFINHLCS